MKGVLCGESLVIKYLTFWYLLNDRSCHWLKALNVKQCRQCESERERKIETQRRLNNNAEDNKTCSRIDKCLLNAYTSSIDIHAHIEVTSIYAALVLYGVMFITTDLTHFVDNLYRLHNRLFSQSEQVIIGLIGIIGCSQNRINR